MRLPWSRHSRLPAGYQPVTSEELLAQLAALPEEIERRVRESREQRWADARGTMCWYAADHPGDHTRCQIAYPGQPMTEM